MSRFNQDKYAEQIVLPFCYNCNQASMEHLYETLNPDGTVLVKRRCLLCGRESTLREKGFLSDYVRDRNLLCSAIADHAAEAKSNTLLSDEAKMQFKVLEQKYGRNRLDNDLVIDWYKLLSNEIENGISHETEVLYQTLTNPKYDTSRCTDNDLETIQNLRTRLETRRAYFAKRARRKRTAWITSLTAVLLLLAAAAVFLLHHLDNRTVTLEMPNHGITVKVPGDAFSLSDAQKLGFRSTRLTEDSSEYAVATHLLRKYCQKLTVYDLFLTVGGSEQQPKKAVSVTLPIPEDYRRENVAVYHINEDGSYEELPCSVSTVNGTVTFETEHFSLFALAEKPYTVTWDPNNGEKKFDTLIVWGKPIDRVEDPVMEGYTFAGWHDENRKEWDFSSPITHAVTLEAYWEPNRYTVTLDPDEGELLGDAEISVTFHNLYDLPAAHKEGYYFIEWRYGDKPLDEMWSIPADVTLTAVWELRTYELTYSPNGGPTMPDSVKEVKYGETVKTDFVSNRIGYEFKGWYTTPTCEKKVESLTMGAKDVTLYAGWEPISYTIEFNANDGEGTPPDSIFCLYDESIQLEKTSLSVYCKQFAGWALSPDGAPLYMDGTTISNLTKKADDTVVLYAIWDLVTTTYTGISNSPETVRQDYGRVVYDWSQQSPGDTKGFTINIYPGVEEVVLKGNPSLEYSNTAILFQEFRGQEVTVIFDNFRMYGSEFKSTANGYIHGTIIHENCQPFTVRLVNKGTSSISSSTIAETPVKLRDLIIEGSGNLTINGSDGDYSCYNDQHGGNAIEVNNLTIRGNLNLTVKGGKGDDGDRNESYGGPGADGGTGIRATDLVLVEMSGGSLTVTGGAGGNAFNRRAGDNDGDGSNGRNGFSGGSGGSAIFAKSIIHASGTATFTSGKAGNGGHGSEGNGNFFLHKKGGNGGNGGTSMTAVMTQSLHVIKGTVTATGVDGGNGGYRGGIHDDEYGDRGSQGKGGAGSTALSADCRVTVESAGKLIKTDGQKGADGNQTNGD